MRGERPCYVFSSEGFMPYRPIMSHYLRGGGCLLFRVIVLINDNPYRIPGTE